MDSEKCHDIVGSACVFKNQGSSRVRKALPDSRKGTGGLNVLKMLAGYYHYRATQILHKWLNRKNQRKEYNWAQFKQVLDLLDWPSVEIRKDLNPFRREEAC